MPHLVERFDPYACGKAKQDEIVREYGRLRGLPYVIVRPGVTFGPGKPKIPGRVGIDTFGVFLHLGMGHVMPFTYVENCAEAIVLAGLIPGIEGEEINIVDDALPTSRAFLRRYKRSVRRFLTLPVPYPAFYLFNAMWEKVLVVVRRPAPARLQPQNLRRLLSEAHVSQSEGQGHAGVAASGADERGARQVLRLRASPGG